MEDKIKILVVDDEEDLCEILQFNLEGEGYEVDTAFSAEEALKKDLKLYSLFLLDVMMGKMSGFKLAEILRKERNIDTPIIFVTAKNTENDLLTGFNIGSDDYITKPFSIKEVLVRVKAVLKRPGRHTDTEHHDNHFQYGTLLVNSDSKTLTVDDEEIELTKKEFEILIMLIRNMHRYYSREDILYNVWGDDVVVSERTIDVHITRLRKKLGSYGKYLISKSGYGYRLRIKN